MGGNVGTGNVAWTRKIALILRWFVYPMQCQSPLMKNPHHFIFDDPRLLHDIYLCPLNDYSIIKNDL